MIQDILLAFWFLLPAAIANAVPVFAAKLPGIRNWEAPIDGGKKWRGHELLGPHKTWRGIVSGIVAATLILGIQQWLYVSTEWGNWVAGPIDYTALPVLLLGPLFAIGALGGDALESFFKRARGIKSGRSWFPFDQLDYIIGAVIVSLFFVILEPVQYVWMFVVWFVMHLIVSYIGYRLGLKKAPI
jgi:CDP-2,3-bis-(O-geranylgeranyl)-sn-glycerol synthase